MHEAAEHYAKWNKPGRERQVLYDITYIENLKQNKVEFTQAENGLIVA